MTDTQDVQRYTDAIMTMIKEDQSSGQVPHDVSSWDELDNCVDADSYLWQAQLPSGTHEASELRDTVTSEVSQRLFRAQGGAWRVTWTQPGGHPVGIGRAIGYATRAEAEAVGREYLTEHQGMFHVHGE